MMKDVMHDRTSAISAHWNNGLRGSLVQRYQMR